MTRRIMYAVYRTKRRGNDNAPIAMFDTRAKADDSKKSYEPTWCSVKWWVGRVWMEDNRERMKVYTISEHAGYHSKGFKAKGLARLANQI